MRLLARMGACCRTKARLERVVEGRREMLVMPLSCGSRACRRCGEGLRERAADRMERGPTNEEGERIEWRSFVTLTMRVLDVPAEEAWERVGGWVSRWIEAAKKHSSSRISYARVLEPTKRGWPHVHMVLSVRHPGRESAEPFRLWACDMWQKITGCHVSKKTEWKRAGKKVAPYTPGATEHGIGCDWQPIRSRAAAAKYLSLYLSKSHLDIWHYAILGKKRIWTTSRDVQPVVVEPSGWRMERVIPPWDDPARDPDAAAELQDAGWIERWTMDDGPSMWVRPEWDALREDTWRVGWLAEVWRGSTDPCTDV